MADCVNCGTKAGMGKKLCASCSEQERLRIEREQAEQAAQEQAAQEALDREIAERARREEEARRQRLSAFLDERISELEALLDAGVPAYLYESLNIDAQSFFNESPNPRAWSFKTETSAVGSPTDVERLQALGLRGWEVVGVIPITYGSTLYNTVGGNTVYAAAHSGLVVGAELLLRRLITRQSLAGSQDEVRGLLAREFPG